MNNIPVFKFAIREDLKDTEDLFLPKKGEPYATGWDVYAAMHDRKDLIIRPQEYFKIPLGFRTFTPEGWWFQLNPRSSSFVKKYMHNLIGIIDEHYSHELIFAGQYLPEYLEGLTIKFGESIGQIIPFKKVDMKVESITNDEFELLCDKRHSIRKGGFGSTDIK